MENDGFVVKKISKEMVVNALTLEQVYENIRIKRKLIEKLKERYDELGDCQDSLYLRSYIKTLKAEVKDLMRVFRGRKSIENKKVTLNLSIKEVVEYLGLLCYDGLEKNSITIRKIVNAVDNSKVFDSNSGDIFQKYKQLVDYYKGK